MPDPIVTLKAGGLALTSFDALTIRREIDSIADAFSFTGASRPEIRARIKPRQYTPAEVWLDKTKVLTGQIEKIDTSLSGASINFEGRSKTGAMIECSLGEPSNWSNLTLGYIGGQKATLYGTKVSLPQGDSKPCGQTIGSPEQTVADFLQTLAHDMGWLWHSNADGALELIRPNPKGKPVAALIEGQGALQDVAFSCDDTGMFQTYKATMQMGSWPALKASVTDPGIKVHRFIQRSGATGESHDIDRAARQDMAESIAKAFTMQVTLSTWTTDAGIPFEPGQIITLKAPSVYIDNVTAFMISSVEFGLAAGEGFKTTLNLVLPTLYSFDPIGAFPWD
jgi:prophage tail gpP-like protein